MVQFKAKFLFVLILLLQGILYGQERITEIEEDEFDHIDYYYEYGGKKFIANSYAGYLKCYHVDGENVKLIWEQANYEAPIFKFDYLLAQSKRDFLVYDLVKNEIKIFPKISDYKWFRFNNFDKNQVTLIADYVDGPYQRHFLLDFSKGLIPFDGALGSVVSINGNWCVFHGWSDDGSGKNKYTLVNKVDGTKQVLVSASTKKLDFNFEGDTIWFFNSNAVASSYSISTKEFTAYPNLKLRANHNTYKFYHKDSLLILVSGAHLTYGFYTYNLNSSKIIKNLVVEGPEIDLIYLEQINFFDRYFVISTYYSNLIRYDYLSGERTIYAASIIWDHYFDIGRLKISNRSVQFAEGKLSLIDLDANTIEYFDYIPEAWPTLPHVNILNYTNSAIIEEDDESILVSFEAGYSVSHSNQLRIYKKTKKVEVTNLIERKGGLHVQSRLFKLKDEILVFSKNLYHIKGKNIYQINEIPLFDPVASGNVPYKIYDDYLEYYCKFGEFGVIVFRYDGCNSTSIDTMASSKTLYNWFYQKNRFYVFDGSFLYKVKNNIRTIIGKTDYNKFESNIIEGHVYYVQDKSIMKYDGEESQLIATFDASVTNLFTANGITYVRSDKTYRIDNSGLVSIKNTENKYISNIIKTEFTEYLIARTSSELGYIKDDEFIILKNDSSILVNIDNGFALIRKRETANLIQLSTFEISPLPTLENGRYVGLSHNGYDTLIYAICDYERKIRVFKIKNLVETELKYEFDVIQLSDYAFFKAGEDNNYVMNIGRDKLFYIDHYSRMKEIKTNYVIPYLYEDVKYSKGFVYYFGYDTHFGKQIYRYSIETDLYEYPKKKLLDFVLKPNLTSNHIEVVSKTRADINFDYFIFDMSGKRIRIGKLNNDNIDVSELSRGLYVLKMFTLEGEINLKFVKM